MIDSEGITFDLTDMKWKTVPQGAATDIVAAFDTAITSLSRSYLEDCQIDNDHLKPYTHDDAQAKKMWTLSEQLVRQQFVNRHT
jgi:hypothetical protein